MIPPPFIILPRLFVVNPFTYNCAAVNEESILVSDINRMSTLSFTISRFYSYPRKWHKEIVTVIEVIQTLIHEENS